MVVPQSQVERERISEAVGVVDVRSEDPNESARVPRQTCVAIRLPSADDVEVVVGSGDAVLAAGAVLHAELQIVAATQNPGGEMRDLPADAGAPYLLIVPGRDAAANQARILVDDVRFDARLTGKQRIAGILSVIAGQTRFHERLARQNAGVHQVRRGVVAGEQRNGARPDGGCRNSRAGP